MSTLPIPKINMLQIKELATRLTHICHCEALSPRRESRGNLSMHGIASSPTRLGGLDPRND